jgi:DNA invertase Pin-like site-specific DNA recombinase
MEAADPTIRLENPGAVCAAPGLDHQEKALMIDSNPNANDTGKIAAVIYAAKSTTDVRGSIPTQLEDCRRMAEREGWEIAAEHQDEAYSAYHGDRGPGLAAAWSMASELAAEHGRAVLVAQHSDRFSRGDGLQATHLAEWYFRARRAGVELRSVEDDSTFTNPLLAVALGERNAEDSRRKAAAVKAGMRRRAERGKLAGGPRPFGYRWVGPKLEKHLEVVPAEAEIVRRVYEDTMSGASQMALARALMQEGVPTATGKRNWTQSSVRNILVNQLYMGKVEQTGEVFDGEHDAIVSEETWLAAKAVRDAAARAKGNGGGRNWKGPHLLTRGLLKCGRCGSSMIPRPPDRKRERTGYYVCEGRRYKGAEFCDQPYLRQEEVDLAILSELSQRYLDIEQMRERLRAKLAADEVIAAEVLADAEREGNRAKAALTRIERDYIEGRITADQWNRLGAKLITEAKATTAAAERAHEQVARLQQNRPDDAEEAVLRQMAELRAGVLGRTDKPPSLDALRRTLRQLFEAIIYWPADLEMPWLGEYTVDSIPWTDNPEDLRKVAAAFAGGALLPVLARNAVIGWNPDWAAWHDPSCGHKKNVSGCCQCFEYYETFLLKPGDSHLYPRPIIRKTVLPVGTPASTEGRTKVQGLVT